MKERPILFSAPMVRSLLDGSKTQTRRIAPISLMDIKHHGEGMLTWAVHFLKPIKGGIGASHSGGRFTEQDARRIIASQFCPYGKPGDRLWVRETWAPKDIDPECMTAAYRSTDDERNGPWKPSIHMPRWASRLTLEIVSVRVERLNEISEADAQAEGVESPETEREEKDWKICPTCGGTRLYDSIGACYGVCPDTDCYQCDTHAKRYRHLWESINGPGSWAANPMVWVIEFRKLANETGAQATTAPSAQRRAG